VNYKLHVLKLQKHYPALSLILPLDFFVSFFFGQRMQTFFAIYTFLFGFGMNFAIIIQRNRKEDMQSKVTCAAMMRDVAIDTFGLTIVF